MTANPRLIALPFTLLLFQPLLVRADDADALLDRARTEYPPAVKRLEAAYARVRGSGHSRTTIPPSSGERIIAVDFSFAFDGDRKRTIRHLVITTPNVKVSEEDVFCFNKKYNFGISRESADEPYLVKGFAINAASPPPGTNETVMDIAGNYLGAASNLYGMPMSRILESPRFRFTKATALSEEGGELVELEFENPEPNPGPGMMSGVYAGSIVVDPANSWRIQKAECFFAPSLKRPFRVTVDYGPSIDGIPVPRNVTVVEPSGITREWEFTAVKFAGSPESEFTLAAFGLPDLSALPEAGPSETSLSPWIVALGAVGLLAAILLYFLARRAESRRVAPSGAPNG